MSNQELEAELQEIAADSIDGILTLLDVMAGDPPPDYDFDKNYEACQNRQKRVSEIMNSLSRDAILKAKDIKLEKIDTSEWFGADTFVFVKGMTGTERDSFEASILTMKGKKQEVNLANLRAKLAVRTLCDENGARLFTDADAEDLGQHNAAFLQKVFYVSQKLSGIGDDEVKEMTEGLKDPFGDSPSGSV